MQNAGIAELGLDWRYLAFDVAPSDLASAIVGARTMKFVGLNLTVPHKLLAVEWVDVLDESAKVWGAVNTIRFEARDRSGTWQAIWRVPPGEIAEVRSCGFNTDADALTRALREDLGLEPRGASVLLLGAGGAGRVAALKLAAEGVGRLFLVNRTMSKAGAIADEIRTRFAGVQVELGYPGAGVDLVLNATSMGLKPEDPWPFDATQFSLENARAAYDMIYRPAETRFLAAARAAGCRTANGIGMLLYQGARALEIWTEASAPVAVMRRALEENIYV